MHRLWRLQAAKQDSLPEESKNSVSQSDEVIEELPLLADPEAAEVPMDQCQHVYCDVAENSAGETSAIPAMSPLEAFEAVYMSGKPQVTDLAFLRPLPILSALSGASDNSTCELCTTSASTHYCACTGREVLMCERCIGPHCCKFAGSQHSVAHIRHQRQGLLLHCERGKEAVESEFGESLLRVDQCCAELAQTVDLLVAQLIRYRDRMIEELKLRRAELDRINTEMRGYQPNATPLFTYTIDSSAVSAAIESLLSVQDLQIDAEYTEPAVWAAGKVPPVSPQESVRVIAGERHRVTQWELVDSPLGVFGSAVGRLEDIDEGSQKPEVEITKEGNDRFSKDQKKGKSKEFPAVQFYQQIEIAGNISRTKVKVGHVMFQFERNRKERCSFPETDITFKAREGISVFSFLSGKELHTKSAFPYTKQCPRSHGIR